LVRYISVKLLIQNILIMKLLTALFVSILASIASIAQVGGRGTYAFLNLPNSARVAALGGSNISLNDNDLDFVFHNPSLLNSKMHNSLVFNYVNYFIDISYGYASYSRSFDKYGSFAAGIHYINYGEFQEADEEGNRSGKFTAKEYALNLFWAKPLFDSLLSVGINLKPIYSVFEAYTSFGLATDLGLTYNNLANKLSAAFVLKNIGSQLKPYYNDHYETLPFEIQFGVSKQLNHAPFRFSLTAQHLETPDLTYEKASEENISDFNINENSEKKENKLLEYGNMALLHLIFGVELLLSENFHIRLGYNHLRRQELQIDERKYLSGISTGFGLKISKFKLSYGIASYHIAGFSNHLSVGVNLNEFYTRKL